MAISILLVDADANFRRALRIALSLEGVAVGEASTLEEARRLIQEQSWSCALVDLLLPCAEGPRAVELVAAAPTVGLVIACSTHPELLAPYASRYAVLDKPFTPGVLLALGRDSGARSKANARHS